MELLNVLHFSGRFLALPTIIGPVCKGKEVENTLAYYEMATIRAVKIFMELALDVGTNRNTYDSNVASMVGEVGSIKGL